MSVQQDLVNQLAKKISEIVTSHPPEKHADKQFEVLRSRVEEVLGLFAEDNFNTRIVDEANRIIYELESILVEDMTGFTFERARTNPVIISSRIKQTHYAAYLAGKYSEAEDIGDKFKCWMHNAAANGAVMLGEAIDESMVNIEGEHKRDNFKILRVFRNGAFEDAARFLSFSLRYDPESALTQYNIAKLDVLSKDPALRENGVANLARIRAPKENPFHPADIAWAHNNYDMFVGKGEESSPPDRIVRKIIATHYANQIGVIEQVLRNNLKVAIELEKDKGDIWKKEKRKSKAYLITSTVGLLVLGLMAIYPEIKPIAQDFLRVLSENLYAIVYSGVGETTAQLATLGDGGLAGTSVVNVAFESSRAVFGDGGLA